MIYEFLDPRFLAAMNEIGQYGFQKYGDRSFQHRMANGDTSRGDMERTTPAAITTHAAQHLTDYLAGLPHDHFGTKEHQLAAAAFNAMMEFYFAGLADE